MWVGRCVSEVSSGWTLPGPASGALLDIELDRVECSCKGGTIELQSGSNGNVVGGGSKAGYLEMISCRNMW